MEEWKEYKLGEFATFKTGKLNSNAAVENGCYPFFTCSPETLRINDYAFDQKAILLAGNNAEGNFNIKYYEGKFNAYQRTYVINPIDKRLDIKFLYYALSICLQSFKRISQGTSTKFLTAQILNNFNINVPPLPTQQKIANILSSLDDKIEVNRRINEQLEELAGALFKSWFVDFEPFKDGEFVDSELGMIPKGWKVGTLSDIGEVVGGATPSKSKSEYYTDNGISWITPKDLSINKDKFISKGEIDITELGYSKCSAKMMPRGSVLFSSRAPIGYIAIAKNELCTNQGFKSVVPQLAGTAFIYYYLKNNVSNIESMASGSTFKEASGALMKSLNVIVPPSNILQDFEEKVCSIFDKQESLEEEIHHLTTLRDTLLPKLMSGEIDVNEVKI